MVLAAKVLLGQIALLNYVLQNILCKLCCLHVAKVHFAREAILLFEISLLLCKPICQNIQPQCRFLLVFSFFALFIVKVTNLAPKRYFGYFMKIILWYATFCGESAISVRKGTQNLAKQTL